MNHADKSPAAIESPVATPYIGMLYLCAPQNQLGNNFTLIINVQLVPLGKPIGDQQPNAAKKYTFTTHNLYQATSPLLPSGLLGSVQVIRVSSQQP